MELRSRVVERLAQELLLARHHLLSLGHPQPEPDERGADDGLDQVVVQPGPFSPRPGNSGRESKLCTPGGQPWASPSMGINSGTIPENPPVLTVTCRT